MRTLAKTILGFFSLATVLTIAGCGYHNDKEKYYLVAVNIQLPYWQAAASGIRRAAHEMGIQSQFSGPDSYDAQAQVQAFRQAVAANPGGILVSPADPKLMTPEIDRAIEQGIAVITVDSDAPLSKRLFYVGTNNVSAGELGARVAIRKTNGKGNFVVFTMPGQANLDERLEEVTMVGQAPTSADRSLSSISHAWSRVWKAEWRMRNGSVHDRIRFPSPRL